MEYCVCVLSHFSCVLLFTTLWTVARQASLSMGFFRQEYWSGLPFPTPGDLPDPRIKPTSPALAGGFFSIKPPGKAPYVCIHVYISVHIHTYRSYMYLGRYTH